MDRAHKVYILIIIRHSTILYKHDRDNYMYYVCSIHRETTIYSEYTLVMISNKVKAATRHERV